MRNAVPEMLFNSKRRQIRFKPDTLVSAYAGGAGRKPVILVSAGERTWRNLKAFSPVSRELGVMANRSAAMTHELNV
jgi:hypothetical protein